MIIEDDGLSFEDIGEGIRDEGINPNQRQQGNKQRANRGTNVEIDIRNKFLTYCNSPDREVNWQRNFAK